MSASMRTFIFDIGKTNIKAAVLDERGQSVWSRSMPNRSVVGGAYLQFDVECIWHWLQETLREAANDYPISAINVSTHGACAVLLDSAGELVLPVMDYEFDGLVSERENYRDVRPPFRETLSPELAAGLNLGRQLWWLKSSFPGEFGRVATLLMYPQFWVWKLTGIAVTEITSLGCHTDLWEPAAGRYSALVDKLSIAPALQKIVSATAPAGFVSPRVARTLGLDATCEVYPGVHDSNASFAGYLYCGIEEKFTVVATGTWIVSMCNEGNLAALAESRDVLANVNALRAPVACARFMGGREFDEICQRSGRSVDAVFGESDVQHLVKNRVFAVPPFVTGSGPFQSNAATGGKVVGGEAGPALATLYLALMIDYELSLLQAEGTVMFGSISKKNPLLCALLAQLRPELTFLSSDDSASTIMGAWCLTRWDAPVPAGLNDFETVSPARVDNLLGYREQWLAQILN